MSGLPRYVRKALREVERASRGRQNPWATLAFTLSTLAIGEFGRRLYRDRRVFLPQREPLVSWTPCDYSLPADAVEELYFNSADGERLHGWYCRAPEPVASVFYCHGNKGNLTNSAHVLPHFLRLGLSVFLFDYRGFGRSTGRATAPGVLRDALAAALVHERIRPDGVPSLAYGFSLGGPIAATTAGSVPFDGLVLQSTFTTLSDVARHRHPGTPMHIASGRVFDTISSVRKLTIPVMVVHGEQDEVCPLSMAHSLFDACREPWRLHVVANAGHDNVHSVAGDSVRELVREFSGSLPARPRRLDPFLTAARVTILTRVQRLLRKQADRFGMAPA